MGKEKMAKDIHEKIKEAQDARVASEEPEETKTAVSEHTPTHAEMKKAKQLEHKHNRKEHKKKKKETGEDLGVQDPTLQRIKDAATVPEVADVVKQDSAAEQA